MNWWLPHKFEEKRPYLETRMELIKFLRRFFDEQGFLEVETPALQTMPTADVHIHGFKLEKGPYLHTSPEFTMKKLLVAGLPQIYQICKVFRDEQASKLNVPEFTMLEWYRAGAGYRDAMDDCVNILRYIAEALELKSYTYGGKRADSFLKWNIISISEAFDRYTKINLENYLEDTEAFSAAVQEEEIRVAADDRWDDLFFRVMAEKIEPHLGVDVPCILYDYPVQMASLARKKPEDPRFAERFEVYVCGVELANGFGELTDAAEQRARFEADMALKQEIYGESYPIDEDFLKALEHGLPDCSGVALGLDRLAMLVSGAEDIEKVLWTTSNLLT